MKKNEIVIGGYYRATISGNIVTVKVDGIEDLPYGDDGRMSKAYTKGKPYKRAHTAYYVTVVGGNKLKEVFRSPNRFHCVAKNACGSPVLTTIKSNAELRRVMKNKKIKEQYTNSNNSADLSNQRWCNCDKCGKRIMTESKDGFMVTRCSECFEKYGEAQDSEPTILRDTQHPEGL